MTVSRKWHTATLLQSGEVLIVGGEKNGAALASVELYNPETADWREVASLAVARFSHTATLLTSGKVLVVGGGGPAGSEVELYDPAVDSWTTGGSLQFARRGHTTTLLPSGSVLIAGGDRSGGFLSSAEIYDPISDAWTVTGDLLQARTGHTSILLPTGRVLVGGGKFGTVILSSCELYDASAGTWEQAHSLTTPRADHVSVLVPVGKVFVAAGRAAESSYLSSAELFESAIGAWTEAVPLRFDRVGHTATMLFPFGQILFSGGTSGGQPLASAERYDPTTGEWPETGSLNTSRTQHTSTLLPSGEVLVAGGRNADGTPIASAELLDPLTGDWEEIAPLPTPTRLHTATALSSGKVLVVGGFQQFKPVRSVFLYDPQEIGWTEVNPLANGHSGHTSTLLPSGKVLVVGGAGEFTIFSNTTLYDPQTTNWIEADHLVHARTAHTATLLKSGRVLIVGGYNGSALSSAEIYDPETQAWALAGYLGTARYNHTATRLPSGEVLVVGGYDGALSTATVELYDPATGLWREVPSLTAPRRGQTASLLASGSVWVAGGRDGNSGGAVMSSVEVYRPTDYPSERRPVITSFSPILRYDTVATITGIRFHGDSEANSGHRRGSATNYPLVQLLDPISGEITWLSPDPRPNFADDPMTLTVSRYPPTLHPRWYFLSVSTNGLFSEAVPVRVECSLVISRHPADQSAHVGSTATFSIETQGGRVFQWQKNGIDIPGATGSSYTTLPITPADSGTTYRVIVDTGCTSATSEEAVLTVLDDTPPSAKVIYPSGGEYWTLSDPDPERPPNIEVITWEMSDNIRICQVEVSLLYSDNGGESFQPAPEGGGLPATFGDGGACPHPGEPTTSVPYTVPSEPPSGSSGSLYKIQVRVTDDAGQTTSVESENPFFIVQPNHDSVKTLLLANLSRMQGVMGITATQAADLGINLQDLAGHPRVQGLVVDLGGVTDLTDLYTAWDAAPGNADRANQVLFGCHAPLPPGCTAEKDGIHDLLRGLLRAYTGVESIVLVGDDRILPMTRIQDRTGLFPEQGYPETQNGDLTPDGTTVGQALAANKYLSDDPLAVLDLIHADELGERIFLPDVAVGRLVETPSEIITTIATYISHDGVLDLAALDSEAGHKIQVTGYDFLRDSARRISKRWKKALGQPASSNSLAPVDGELIGEDWDEVDLQQHLCGNGGVSYGLLSLNGHAVHYAEGVPGSDPFDIRGLDASNLVDATACGFGHLDLSGSVLYAVGCHGGLPVAGSDPTDADHSLDLPQTFLSRGAVAYVANSGYGWGLRHGIGYSERLMELFTEEMSRGGTVGVGEAVQRAKQRYFLEAPRFDPYDEKTVMQWTLFGLPMYAVDTGIPDSGATAAAFAGYAPSKGDRPTVERFGPVAVDRRLDAPFKLPTPPAFLTRLQLHFDLNAPGVYTKYNAAGEVLANDPGCPAPAPGEPEGCYYTLNGLVERSTGVSDHPIQPYFIYDSRLSGTSQHGVLWMGGGYEEESDWIPVIAELVSNGGDGSDHGAAPRHHRNKTQGRRVVLGEDPPLCRPSDLEVNSLVVTTGEVLKAEVSDETYSIQRLYREMDLEIFYFNNTTDSSQNCDPSGPELLPGPFSDGYHRVSATTVEWAVPVSDAAGVWRVVVVYNDGTVDGAGRGRWTPLELSDDAGTWRGSVRVDGPSRLTYALQAVDRRGNVSWLEYETTDLPASGVPLDLPDPVDVDVTFGTADLTVTVSDAPDPVTTESPLVYTVAVHNLGPDPASSVVVADSLPAEVSFVLAWGEGWSCEAAAGEVSCSRDFLDVAQTAPPITVLTNAPAATGTLVNMVSVEAAQPDPQGENNTVSEATTVSLIFTVVEEVGNPAFDQDLSGWLLDAPSPASITHSTEDVAGAATSGSALVADLSGLVPATLSQCVARGDGETVIFGGAARIASAGAAEPVVFALLEAFSAPDCSGDPLTSVATAPLAGDTGGLWRRLSEGALEVPAEAGSLLLSLVVRAEGASSFEVRFDDVFLELAIFVDGFESGNTSRWTAAQP